MSEPGKANIYRQAVSEADIDWLFCVELNACDEFRSWAASRLFPDVPEFEHDRAWRSVSTSLGESDLIWRIELPEKEYAICLIENKIKAVAQPEQYNRYVQRGHIEVEEARCKRFSVALIAPAKYESNDSSAYPLRISYEEIVKWLQSRSDKRSKYLADIYQTAIDKHGKPAVIDEDMTRFRQNIYRLATSEFPELRMPDPKEQKADQNWVEWNLFGPKSGCIFKYKMDGTYAGKCVLDLELNNNVYGNDVEHLRNRYAKALTGTKISVMKPVGATRVVCRLPVSNIESPIYDEEAVRNAMKAASTLKDFWEKANALPTAKAED